MYTMQCLRAELSFRRGAAHRRLWRGDVQAPALVHRVAGSHGCPALYFAPIHPCSTSRDELQPLAMRNCRLTTSALMMRLAAE